MRDSSHLPRLLIPESIDSSAYVPETADSIHGKKVGISKKIKQNTNEKHVWSRKFIHMVSQVDDRFIKSYYWRMSAE